LLRRLLPLAKNTYVLVEIDGPVAEFLAPPRLWEFHDARSFSIYEFDALVTAVLGDSRIRGVVLVLKSLGDAGFATATSLRTALARLRQGGKEVVVQLPLGAGTRLFYVALAGDQVFLGPAASLEAVGFLVASRYLRGALDRVGLAAEIHAQGRYKSAGEQLSRDTMSDAEREQVGVILDALQAALVGAIRDGRKVDQDKACAFVDGGPYQGQEAVAAGLVDGVCYEDELSGRLAKDSTEPPLFLDAATYFTARRALGLRRVVARPVIGVLRVHGLIAPKTAMAFVPVAEDERIIAAIRVARRSHRVRAVVVHIDSPGGSALASDRIHHELCQLAREKPMVACFGDVAASGGYYIGMAAPCIVAQPTTLTGSIGVVAARLVLEPALKSIGVMTEVLQRGARAKLLDATLAFDDADRAALDRHLRVVYDGFLAVVAEGRAKPVSDIAPLAEGRVWTGQDALDRGLVDHLGGFAEALRLVRGKLGSGAEKLAPEMIRPPMWAHSEPLAPAPVPPAAQALLSALGVDPSLATLAFCGDRVLAWCPFPREWS
jgi:protease-4